MKKLTEKTIKALNIINAYRPITAGKFAEQMWPDSKMHRKTSNQGNGACRGKAAWLCGGSYMRKLLYAGYIKQVDFSPSTFKLTELGEELIKKEAKDET